MNKAWEFQVFKRFRVFCMCRNTSNPLKNWLLSLKVLVRSVIQIISYLIILMPDELMIWMLLLGRYFTTQQFSCFQFNVLMNASDISLYTFIVFMNRYLYPPHNEVGGGILVSLRLSVRPSRIPGPLCSTYSSGWIHFIFIHLIKQLQKVCRV